MSDTSPPPCSAFQQSSERGLQQMAEQIKVIAATMQHIVKSLNALAASHAALLQALTEHEEEEPPMLTMDGEPAGAERAPGQVL